jgi:uncharacterized membrane protein YkvA (DUF1232 family)
VIPWPLEIFRFIYHLPRLVRLVLRLIKDPRVPFRLKLLPYLGVLYFVLPFDLLRDFPLIYLGYLDDIVVLFFLVRAFLRRCPKEIVAEHLEALTKKPDH